MKSVRQGPPIRNLLAMTLLTAAVTMLAFACERRGVPGEARLGGGGGARSGVETANIGGPVVPGTPVVRHGDEIVVAGRFFRTGTRVVLWTDPDGYDAYRTERRFSPWAEAPFAVTSGAQKPPQGQPPGPARLGTRHQILSWPELEQVRGGGWPLELLQDKVDQFVLHYDAVGFSKYCFMVLHDMRGLSVQFMLDVDGTIYQTMDAKERAFHATTSNHRSVGIEIANRGAYETDLPLREFYSKDNEGPFLTIPARFGDGGLLAPGKLRPLRPELVRGRINGQMMAMYDLTPQQYTALARLTAALCTVLPRITLDYPRDATGHVFPARLPTEQLDRTQGLIAHWHIQEEKYDPGPAFQWDKLVRDARALMSDEAIKENESHRGKFVRPGPLATQPATTPSAPPATTNSTNPPATQPATPPARGNTRPSGR
jgi:N-acetylmuramoyl-L-alanine amidase